MGPNSCPLAFTIHSGKIHVRSPGGEVVDQSFDPSTPEGIAAARRMILQCDGLWTLGPSWDTPERGGVTVEDRDRFWDTITAKRTADGLGRNVLQDLVDTVEAFRTAIQDHAGTLDPEPIYQAEASLEEAMVAARALLGALGRGEHEALPRPPRTAPLHAAKGPEE